MKTSLASALLVPLVVLAGCGQDHPAPVSAVGTAPTTASTAPVVEGPADLVDHFAELEVATLAPGAGATATDGTGIEATLRTRGGRHVLEVRNGADVTATPLARDSDTPYLLDVQLELGQAGAGWVVGREGGDATRLQVFVIRGGRLVAAAPTAGDPPLGGGFTADGRTRRTWFTAAGRMFTEVATGRTGRFRLYGWAVSGPGEGGGADDLRPRLVAEDLGPVCVTTDAERTRVRHC